MKTLLLTLLLVPMMSFGQNVNIPDANKIVNDEIKTLKKKYKYIQAEFTDVEFGDLLHFYFKGIDGKEYNFSFIEDETYQLLDDFDEANPKYKGKMFHVFYLNEERDMDFVDWSEKINLNVIYKMIIKE